MALHLPALLPAVSRCRHLEIVDLICLHHLLVQFPAQVPLESISIALQSWPNLSWMRAVSWVYTLLHHCPRLTKLHWDSPSGLHAPWAQLTHLSWGVGHVEWEFFERTLDQLLQLEYLQLAVTDGAVTDGPEMWIRLPHFTNCSALQPCLSKLQLPCASSSSRNCIISFWNHNSILTPTLSGYYTALSVTSAYLSCGQTTHLNHCFQIEELPEITLGSTSGVLTGLILKHFRGMEMLELNEHLPHSPLNPPEFEHHTVLVGTSHTLIISRHAAFRPEYQAWWTSADSREFHAALEAEDEALLQSFELPVDFMKYGHFSWGKAAGQNLFANTRRPGYGQAVDATVVLETGFYSLVQVDWDTRSGTLGAIEHCMGRQILDPSNDKVAPPPKQHPEEHTKVLCRSKSAGLAMSIDRCKEQYTIDRDNNVRIPPGSE
ncbi:hypothetical protein B0H14DRAFT_2577092 [Mycena olivaceomarginata]|nr:hypothetical protein B0H14DRAFT_2577092 [Mycena olivaceomarginata]